MPPEEAGKPSIRTGTYALRLEVDGSWSVFGFIRMLEHLKESYERVEGFESIFAPAQAGWFTDQPRFKWQYHQQELKAIRDFVLAAPRDFEKVFPVLRTLTGPLAIKAIQIASPGWIEIVGGLSALKVLASVINAYRSENTKRQDIKSKLLRDLVELVPEETRKKYSPTIMWIAESMVDPTFNGIETILVDQKITHASIVESEEQDVEDEL